MPRASTSEVSEKRSENLIGATDEAARAREQVRVRHVVELMGELAATFAVGNRWVRNGVGHGQQHTPEFF